MNKDVIYLDYNATTPVDKRVLDEMFPYFSEKFGNAASVQHVFGWDAEEAVDISRERVAALINAKENDIVFTSGATEAINLALFGLVEGHPSKKHIITCETEHKAVLDCCKKLENQGITVTYLPVDKYGQINLDALEGAITEDTLLVTVMHANNEIGAIHPIEVLAEIAHNKGALFMTDATQSVGKVPFDSSVVDLAAFSAHKLYGPKGVGALFLNKSVIVKLKPQLVGGGHEKGMRSGTLNVPGIVGFGKACEICEQEMKGETERLGILRDGLEKCLMEKEGIQINALGNRLPHMTNLTFQDIDGSKLIRLMKGLAVSQGSACTSTTIEPSHVLKAIGLSDTLALSSLRIGLGRFTTEEEINQASQIILNTVDQLRMQYS